ncbi:hypothetical protein MTO96_002211 [Rhipicephalus appendiculatus]
MSVSTTVLGPRRQLRPPAYRRSHRVEGPRTPDRTPSHKFEAESSLLFDPSTLKDSGECEAWASEAVPVEEGVFSAEKQDPKSRIQSDALVKIRGVARESCASRSLGLLEDLKLWLPQQNLEHATTRLLDQRRELRATHDDLHSYVDCGDTDDEDGYCCMSTRCCYRRIGSAPF